MLIVALGYWALAVPVYTLTAVAAVVWPRWTVAGLVAAMVAVEPTAFDFTGPLSLAIYHGPPATRDFLPLTIAPIEIAILIAAAALPFRGGTIRRSPLVIAAVPLVVLAGMAYGIYRGAPSNLAYHEARGILFGIATFIVLPNFRQLSRPACSAILGLAIGGLAFTIIVRYLVYVRWGSLPIALEFAFAHDSVIYLMFGILLASASLFKAERRSLSTLLWSLLLVSGLIAIFMTGRRAGTMVFLVGSAMFLFTIFPTRKRLAIFTGIILVSIFSVYLGIYWNQEYGTIAQPARAVRSQIDPSPRDESSDIYRDIEKRNIIATIHANKIFGVGFGNEFYRYQPLPDLRSFWELQFYTPHQNILWLWLKMGIVGISVILAAFSLAIARCLDYLRSTDPSSTGWIGAILVATSLAMCLSFATVDVIFPGTRPMAFVAVLFAIATDLGQTATTKEPD